MRQENTPSTKNKKGNSAAVFAVQIITVALVCAALFALKTFAPKEFEKVQKWYNTNILAETLPEQILHGENENAI